MRSVTYGLSVTKTDNLFPRHEFFEEEDILQSFLNGGHNLDQYFSVDYFAFEIESEPIFVLQVEDISLDELLHLRFVEFSHLGHHELINFRHFSILQTHGAVEVRIAADDLTEVLLVYCHETHGGLAIETKGLHVLTNLLDLLLALPHQTLEF